MLSSIIKYGKLAFSEVEKVENNWQKQNYDIKVTPIWSTDYRTGDWMCVPTILLSSSIFMISVSVTIWTETSVTCWMWGAIASAHIIHYYRLQIKNIIEKYADEFPASIVKLKRAQTRQNGPWPDLNLGPKLRDRICNDYATDINNSMYINLHL